jgi:hypothetical protein
MEDPKPKNPEPEREGSDVYVRIEPKAEDIKAGDLLCAHEHGYHRGYMKALRDVAFALVGIMLVAAVLESSFRRV